MHLLCVQLLPCLLCSPLSMLGLDGHSIFSDRRVHQLPMYLQHPCYAFVPPVDYLLAATICRPCLTTTSDQSIIQSRAVTFEHVPLGNGNITLFVE